MGRSSGQAWRISLRSSSVLDASENESASSTRTLAGAHAYGGTAAHRYDHRRVVFSGIGTTENSAYNPRTLERGHYFPEYYTRALTGNCEPEDEKKRKRDPKIPERFRSCGFGGVFQARIPAARAHVIREHFF